MELQGVIKRIINRESCRTTDKMKKRRKKQRDADQIGLIKDGVFIFIL